MKCSYEYIPSWRLFLFNFTLLLQLLFDLVLISVYSDRKRWPKDSILISLNFNSVRTKRIDCECVVGNRCVVFVYLYLVVYCFGCACFCVMSCYLHLYFFFPVDELAVVSILISSLDSNFFLINFSCFDLNIFETFFYVDNLCPSKISLMMNNWDIEACMLRMDRLTSKIDGYLIDICFICTWN